MKIYRQRSFPPEVVASSLADIMFFLLLFFLIVASVANPNVIGVQLPTARTNQTMMKEERITLTVTDDKKYFIDSKEISFSALEEELQKKGSQIPAPTLIIRFSHNLTVQDLIDVMSVGAKYKVKMVLATKHI